MNESNHDKNCSAHSDGIVSKAKLETRVKKMRSFPPNKSRSASNVTVPPIKCPKDAVPLKKLSPDFDSSIYDSLRPSVSAILSVSSKFQLQSSRHKGVVLLCGSDDDQDAKQAGYGSSFLPLKAMSATQPGIYQDNPLIHVLGKYAASRQQEPQQDQDALPALVLGLCCNNWGMYYGRNALIEALLEILGPDQHHKLSIHSAVYALDFNTRALSKILMTTPQGQDHADAEAADRTLHAAAFQASAAQYQVGFDTIEKDVYRFEGVSKMDFVQELSNAVAQAVERTMANDGKTVTAYVMEILRHRRLIQDNLSNKRFRRAPSQNGIATACSKLTELFAENFGSPDLSLVQKIPGWTAYTESLGGVAPALLGLFCHSIDVLAGCVARSTKVKDVVTPDLAERLVLTVLDKDQRLLEYCFNQIYELMPNDHSKGKYGATMYLYRRLGDLSPFSTMPCGAVDMGGRL